MLYAVMPKEDYEHACDVLRDYTRENEPIKSGELEENIDKVYGAGEAAGEEKGYSKGYGDGHKQGVADGLAKTNDATATTDKVVEGETYYAGGKKQTGGLKIAVGGISTTATPSKGYIGSEECVALSYTPEEAKVIYPSQGGITLKAPYSAFGNAEKQHVEKGKTFTSAEGLLMEGESTAYDDGYTDGYCDGFDDGYEEAGGAIKLQEKTVTPTAAEQDVTPDEGYYLSSVKVAAIPYREVANGGGIKVIIG